MVGGALFKRIEEEKGLGGWAPAPRRGIRTVGITDSAIRSQRRLHEHYDAAGAGQGVRGRSNGGTGRVTAKLDYRWHLRELMAARGMFSTTDLRPLLAERGIRLSASQTYRLVAEAPERLSMKILMALLDILACRMEELIEPVPAARALRKAQRLTCRNRPRTRMDVASARCGPSGHA